MINLFLCIKVMEIFINLSKVKKGGSCNHSLPANFSDLSGSNVQNKIKLWEFSLFIIMLACPFTKSRNFTKALCVWFGHYSINMGIKFQSIPLFQAGLNKAKIYLIKKCILGGQDWKRGTVFFQFVSAGNMNYTYPICSVKKSSLIFTKQEIQPLWIF